MTKTTFEDLRNLVTAVLVAGWTGNACLSQWSAMDATSGPSRVLHAAAMIAMAACCLTAIAIILAVAVVRALDAASLLRIRRERIARASMRTRDYRIVAAGCGIR